MAKKTDISFLGVFAASFWVVAAWLLSKHSIDIPTRNPGIVLHLAGIAQILFAGGPVLAGVTLGLAARRVYRGGELSPESITPLETGCFLGGIASLLLGIFMGVRQ